MRWCESVKEKNIKQEKDETSLVVVVLGGILSDGIGHSHVHIYSARMYMHTKALLNVFITLSYEMKILI